MITLLYGQPGTGKSTLGTGMALDYLRESRRVVSNFAIDPAPASVRPNGPLADACVEVIPARPSFRVIESLGIGWRDPADVGREDKCGLLLIDEAGPWLDSRKWQDKDRAAVIDWLLQSRKRGWDVILIAQAPALIDKQVREAVVEAYARCRRTDRMRVPIIGVKLPRMHVAIARYGLDANAPVLQRWWYRGALEHQCYQSYAVFDAEASVDHWVVPPPRLTKWADHEPWWAPLKEWFSPKAPVKPKPKPKHRLVALLEKLPEPDRLKHWRRLEALGAI